MTFDHRDNHAIKTCPLITFDDLAEAVNRINANAHPSQQAVAIEILANRLDRMPARSWIASQSEGIMQAWTRVLGLRHQGVLAAAVRGCDTLPREAATKTLARFYRSAVLNAHCGDPAAAKSFMEVPASEEHWREVCQQFKRECDALPHHYVMHLIHAAEIVGYYHADNEQRERWRWLYRQACRWFHVTPETQEQLDLRLNADEDAFAKGQS